jgi:hypothetical protein
MLIARRMRASYSAAETLSRQTSDTCGMVDEVRLGGLMVSMDASAGSWAVARMGKWSTVACVVPDGFPAYARVFHPALVGDDRREARWSEVAAANGRVTHPAMEWASITGAFRYLNSNDSQPGIWDQRPAIGTLPQRIVQELAATLSGHTQTPDRCCFAIWEGYGGLPYLGSLRPERLAIPSRNMILLSGPLSAMLEESFDEGWYRTAPDLRQHHDYRSPSLWWPEDHAWCVGTDVDLNSSYIGASTECIDALLSNEHLEILPVTADQKVSFDADTLNPRPEGSIYD